LNSLKFFLKLQNMGYVFNFNDAKAYEQWYKNQRNRFEADLENQLLLDMLKPLQGESVLDIGCGTGELLRQFVDMGLQATGLDPSPYMLDITVKNLGNRVDLYRGFGEDLPFDDNSFNYAIFSTTLEFIENPRKAIEESCRVAKDQIFIGALNRYAIRGVQRRLKGNLQSCKILRSLGTKENRPKHSGTSSGFMAHSLPATGSHREYYAEHRTVETRTTMSLRSLCRHGYHACTSF
jgi:ubiquinone/menaquinone biosynthesis C-methylase UbiE